MSVYLRNGRYYYRRCFKGVRYNAPTGIKAGQERLLSARVEQIEAGVVARHYRLDVANPDPNVTLGAYAERYITSSTWKKTAYAEALRLRWMAVTLNNPPMATVSKRDIQRLERALIEAGRSTTTVNRYMEILRHVYNEAIEERLLVENPVRYYQPYAEERGRRALTSDEVRRVLGAARDIQFTATRPGLRQHIYDIMALGMLTGMRLSEIVNLRREYVRDGLILYPYSRTKSKRRAPTGVRAGAKVVVLSPAAGVIIGSGGGGPGFVFDLPRRDAKIMEDVIPSIRKASGVADFTFHHLRHTVSTALASALPIAVAREVLGHADIKTTLRYTHPGLDDKARGGTILENLFRELSPK